ncbi:MAG: hypothetical protein JWL70_2204 [Acidimicrobiia bacterium]|nr:hypothetical protein [Acidimicrobiia bacterium]
MGAASDVETDNFKRRGLSQPARATVGPVSGTLYITGDPAADELLNNDPLALLLGMLLDQQVPMQWAFKGPESLRRRLGGTLDANAIAAMDAEELVAVFCDKPALHRFPAVMARRTHELCVALADNYGGDASKLWKGTKKASVVYERLRELPGFGDEKSRIFLALLAKRFKVRPAGWEEAALPFSDEVPRTIADVTDPTTLAQVQKFKKEMKAAKRDKQGRALA